MSNLFEESLSKNQLNEFLLGEPPYFIQDISGYEEPQCVSIALLGHVVPFWESHPNHDVGASIAAALSEILKSYPDRHRAMYTSIDWVVFYLQYRSKCKSTNPETPYFSMDVTGILHSIASMMKENENTLRLDKRWAGAAWNSDSGLLAPMQRAMRDAQRGANVV
jgi:hypothetical protein